MRLPLFTLFHFVLQDYELKFDKDFVIGPVLSGTTRCDFNYLQILTLNGSVSDTFCSNHVPKVFKFSGEAIAYLFISYEFKTADRYYAKYGPPGSSGDAEKKCKFFVCLYCHHYILCVCKMTEILKLYNLPF